MLLSLLVVLLLLLLLLLIASGSFCSWVWAISFKAWAIPWPPVSKYRPTSSPEDALSRIYIYNAFEPRQDTVRRNWIPERNEPANNFLVFALFQIQPSKTIPFWGVFWVLCTLRCIHLRETITQVKCDAVSWNLDVFFLDASLEIFVFLSAISGVLAVVSRVGNAKGYSMNWAPEELWILAMRASAVPPAATQVRFPQEKGLYLLLRPATARKSRMAMPNS